LVGLEFQARDTAIERFYTDMFLEGDLDYEEFLPEQFAREYFVAGEVTSLAHFSESLGVWSSEEILNPDMVRVSKSVFVEQERVQLLVKEMVEALRQGPSGMPDTEESPSERQERTWEYQMLVKHYPEFLTAAANDDGLDISDALWSRAANKTNPWDDRGTPLLLRSFRTLIMEESINAAQDAVCDRMYAPLIVATLGIENMGDGQPWIPEQSDLDDLRDDFQSALAGDFKFIAHNMGLKVESVLGRETAPRFDQDYDRIDAKLLQAWGIGQALIAGGSAGQGTYASSALNREVCEQLMFGFQKKVRRHINHRMEVIAEAQQHYDYEISNFVKGLRRTPKYREVVIEDPDTGEEKIIRAPKLLFPKVNFATLNLRDEQTERQFISQLKSMGVPISDGTLAVNIKVDFKEELERQSQEFVDKANATGQALMVAQQIADAEGTPYSPELSSALQATLMLRQMLAQTKLAEDQAKMSKVQTTQMTAPAASAQGILPGMPALPPAPADQGGAEGGDEGAPPPPGGAPPGGDEGAPPGAALAGPPQMMAAAVTPLMFHRGPTAHGPGAVPEEEDDEVIVEVPRNRSRPPESDEARKSMPKQARRRRRGANGEIIEIRKPTKFELGPSSWRTSLNAGPETVERAIARREMIARAPTVSELVDDPDFYRLIQMEAEQAQIQGDYPDIRAGRGGTSAGLLAEMIEHYSEITGQDPVWD
jgi:hypothetical protein